MLGHSGTSCAVRLKNTYGCYRPGARARERDSRFATAKRQSCRVRVIEVFRLTHHFSRPDFTGCGFRAHAAATTAILFFNCREESLLLATTHLFFACIGVEFRIQWLLVGNGLEGFCGLQRTTGLAGLRTLRASGHRIGFSVVVVTVVFPRSRLISSHLVSSRLVVLIPSLCSHFPDLFFSQVISRSAKQEAWSGNIANLH